MDFEFTLLRYREFDHFSFLTFIRINDFNLTLSDFIKTETSKESYECALFEMGWHTSHLVMRYIDILKIGKRSLFYFQTGKNYHNEIGVDTKLQILFINIIKKHDK